MRLFSVVMSSMFRVWRDCIVSNVFNMSWFSFFLYLLISFQIIFTVFDSDFISDRFYWSGFEPVPVHFFDQSLSANVSFLNIDSE